MEIIKKLTPFNSNVQGDKKIVRVNGNSSYPGVNYEEVLEQGDSVLVRDSESSIYPVRVIEI